jgi:hypothetical protein
MLQGFDVSIFVLLYLDSPLTDCACRWLGSSVSVPLGRSEFVGIVYFAVYHCGLFLTLCKYR